MSGKAPNCRVPTLLGRWASKVAIVTGASSGIGAAIATTLACDVGMHVVAVARRADRLAALVEQAAQSGGQVTAIAADLTSPMEVTSMLAQLRGQHGAINLLVNNAGAATMTRLDASQPSIADIDINVIGPARLISEVLVDLKAAEEGQIINISSIYAHRDQVPNFAMYQASKAALRALTNTLRAELASVENRVRVGMISPGMVATEFRANATDGAFDYDSYFRDYEPILPQDVADAVVYMLSTRAHVQVQDILLSPLGQGL